MGTNNIQHGPTERQIVFARQGFNYWTFVKQGQFYFIVRSVWIDNDIEVGIHVSKELME